MFIAYLGRSRKHLSVDEARFMMPSRRRYNFILILAGGCWLLATSLWALDPNPSVEFLALHAQRYQDHTQRRVRCEIFGEVKNLSNRPLKGVVIELEFLDEKGKLLVIEEVALTFRVIAPRNARGELRPVRPQEIGHFSQNTSRCPEKWLEGRVRYKIKNIEWK